MMKPKKQDNDGRDKVGTMINRALKATDDEQYRAALSGVTAEDRVESWNDAPLRQRLDNDEENQTKMAHSSSKGMDSNEMRPSSEDMKAAAMLVIAADEGMTIDHADKASFTNDDGPQLSPDPEISDVKSMGVVAPEPTYTRKSLEGSIRQSRLSAQYEEEVHDSESSNSTGIKQPILEGDSDTQEKSTAEILAAAICDAESGGSADAGAGSRDPPPTQEHGAFRVSGSGGDSSSLYDNYTTTQSTTQRPALNEAVSAEVVDPEDENRRVLRRVNEELAERERRISNAELVPDYWCWCSPRIQCMAIVCVILVAVAVALGSILPQVLGHDSTPTPTPMPTTSTTADPSSRQRLFNLLANFSLDGGAAITAPSAPQKDAFDWLVDDAESNDYTDEKTIVQRYTMATLFFSTQGDNWSDNWGWLSDRDECSWYTNAEYVPNPCESDGTVSRLGLVDNNLSGTIPDELALLSNSLVRLDIGDNQLTGKLTPWIGYLTSLTSLNIQRGFLVGSLPSEMGRLIHLGWLSLYRNKLWGQLPTEIGLMTQAGYISLANNNFEGTIPTEIGLLRENLGFFSIWGNTLSGTIPTEIGRLTKMEAISFSDNRMTGSIPSEIGLLTKVVALNLENCKFSGTIPTEIALMTSLQTLQLFNNDLSGEFTCPENIVRCRLSCINETIEACQSL